MLKKLVTGILSLALCASTLSSLPQTAYADEADPTPIVVADPEDPTPVEPGEPDVTVDPEEPEEPLECASEYPPADECEIVE